MQFGVINVICSGNCKKVRTRVHEIWITSTSHFNIFHPFHAIHRYHKYTTHLTEKLERFLQNKRNLSQKEWNADPVTSPLTSAKGTCSVASTHQRPLLQSPRHDSLPKSLLNHCFPVALLSCLCYLSLPQMTYIASAEQINADRSMGEIKQLAFLSLISGDCAHAVSCISHG